MDFQKIKIITFVPIDSAGAVRQALGKAGAGRIGEYSFCSFSLTGQGRFKPSDKANPHIGSAGRLEIVDEERIEVVCSYSIARKVVDALKNIHPYEEPAFEILPLLTEDQL